MDVLVTDIHMPVMDGFELLAHLRERHPRNIGGVPRRSRRTRRMKQARYEDWRLLNLEPGADLTEVNRALHFRRSLYQPGALATYNLLEEDERVRMLARIDGKSPVEYLTADNQKDEVRTFARGYLIEPARKLGPIAVAWCASGSR